MKTSLTTCHLPLFKERSSSKKPTHVLLQDCFPNHTCLPCADKIQEHTGKVLHLVGVVALSFSFTEVSVLNTHCLVLFVFWGVFFHHIVCETVKKKKKNSNSLSHATPVCLSPDSRSVAHISVQKPEGPKSQSWCFPLNKHRWIICLTLYGLSLDFHTWVKDFESKM